MARRKNTINVYPITITNTVTKASRIVDIAETEEIAIRECQRRNRFFGYEITVTMVASYTEQKLNRGDNSHTSTDLV